MVKRKWILPLAFGLNLCSAQGLPQVGLVLSGGGAKGIAHVGVLRALEEAGVPIDQISGTSAGAIVGGLYASGFTPDTLEQIFSNLKTTDAATLTLFDGGLLNAQPLEILLDQLLEKRQVEDTHIPLTITATELANGSLVDLKHVPLSRAIHASMAIQGLFTPVAIGNQYYFDGGFKGNIPVGLTKSKGANYIIVSGFVSEAPYNPSNVVDNFLRITAFSQRDLNFEQSQGANQIIRSEITNEDFFSFSETQRLVQLGYSATQKVLPQILEDLKARGIPLRVKNNTGEAINIGWRERFDRGKEIWKTGPKPFGVDFHLGFRPDTRFSDPTVYPFQGQGPIRISAHLRDGFLGKATVDLGYLGSLENNSGFDAELGYSTSQDTQLFIHWINQNTISTTIGAKWTPEILDGQLQLKGQWYIPQNRPNGLEWDAEFKSAHWSLRGNVYWPLDFKRARTFVDLRTSQPLTPQLSLHLRGLGGWSMGADEPFALGFRSGLRGYSANAWKGSEIYVGNAEIEWQPPTKISLLGSAMRPALRTFIDIGKVPYMTGVAWNVGVGAGINGDLIGFFPIHLGVNVGYAPVHNSFQTTLVTDIVFP
ncbi:MAG: patatin-like phospholipase family protein [Deinococcaceae bacterium]